MTQKSKQIITEFNLTNENYTHLKFKTDELHELYIARNEQDNYVSIIDIKNKISKFKDTNNNFDLLHSINQYESYIDELVLNVQNEIDNKTIKSI